MLWAQKTGSCVVSCMWTHTHTHTHTRPYPESKSWCVAGASLPVCHFVCLRVVLVHRVASQEQNANFKRVCARASNFLIFTTLFIYFVSFKARSNPIVAHLPTWRTMSDRRRSAHNWAQRTQLAVRNIWRFEFSRNNFTGTRISEYEWLNFNQNCQFCFCTFLCKSMCDEK